MAYLFDYLFDTNIFLRLAEKNGSERLIILNGIRKIRANNQTICYTPQILAEFWNVCTRPANARGGFGLSIEQTERKVNLIQKYFEILPDTLQTFTEWRKLVSDYKVSGVQVHDAKLAASINVHKVEYLVTLNDQDFKRFGIKVIPPGDV
ncbi:MAG: type II toxin-antitoxin system VapC family toxin [Pyrinomonadaceae bacterium]